MKYSHKLSDAIHVMAYIEIFKDGELSSKTIADSVESNPSLIRRLLSQLTKKGLIISRPGVSGRDLARPANEITILDIYKALGDEDLLHIDKKTNPKCIVGGNIQTVLDQTYAKVQHAAEQEMSKITLADVIDAILVNDNQGHL